MIRGIIFDLDGTSINTLEDLHNAVNLTMAEYGYPLKSIDDVRMGIGQGFRKLMDAVLPAGVDEEQKAAVGSRYMEIYSENYDLYSKPYPGFSELLKELQERGIKLAINSNKGDRLTRTLISQCFPDIEFTAVCGERENIPRKPDPYAANEIIEQMGLKKEEVLYVGDSNTDIATGKNAGVKTVGCLWGFRDYETLKQAGADKIISEPKELLECLSM